jgi:hypothetical protein
MVCWAGGQLLLRQGHTEAAEGLYRKALSIAEEQGPSSGNCAPPRASLGSAVTRATTPKAATFWVVFYGPQRPAEKR